MLNTRLLVLIALATLAGCAANRPRETAPVVVTPVMATPVVATPVVATPSIPPPATQPEIESQIGRYQLTSSGPNLFVLTDTATGRVWYYNSRPGRQTWDEISPAFAQPSK